MRRAAKVDENQAEIVEMFRKLGCTVQLLHNVGSGCPDISVGLCGVNLFVEIKDGSLPPSRRKLTKEQEKWHDSWHGQVIVVKSVQEAVRLVSIVRHHYIDFLPKKITSDELSEDAQ